MRNRSPLAHLSALGAWAVAFGCAVGWDVFTLPWTSFLPKAGPVGTILGLAAAALAMVVVAWNFHYMIGKCPGLGGVYSYAKTAFGHDHGYICAWFLCLAYAAIVWADAEMLTVVVRYLVGGNPFYFGFKYHVAGFKVCLGDIVMVAAAMVAVVAISVRRRVAAAVQTVLAVTLALGLVVCFGAAVCSHVGGFASMRPLFSPGGGPVTMQVLGIIAISPWLFVGIESISGMSAEFRFPLRRSFGIMVAAIAASVAAYVLICLVPVLVPGGGAGWPAALAGAGDAETRAFDAVRRMFGGAGTAVLGLTLACALFTNLVGNTIVASRLLVAMADDGALPLWLGRKDGVLSARNAIFVIAAMAVVTAALGQTVIGVIVDVALVGTSVAYAYTSAAVFKVARKEGDRLSAATGLVGLVFSAATAVQFILPAASATMGTASYLVLVLWCIAGIVFFLFAFHRDRSHRFGRSSVVWVSLFLVILSLSHIWARQTADETVRRAYRIIMNDHCAASMRSGRGDGAETSREQTWQSSLNRDLRVVRRAIINNSEIHGALTVLSLVLMIAVYMLLRRRELDMERDKAKAKSYFFSTVSHDIRTPLNAIIGFSEMLRAGFKTEDERNQAVDAIVMSGKTLLGLVNDVLDLSKLESGKMEIVPEPTDCAKLLREVTDAFRVAHGEPGVEIRCRVGEMPPLMIDPQRLRQIAFNLVGNAVKFTKKGYVELRASFSDGAFSLEVEDTGCGISEEDLGRIGSAYVQVGSKLSRNGGTGLGLAICKQLVATMGGRLDVKSELGKGSTFTISIPNVAAACEAVGGGASSGGDAEAQSPAAAQGSSAKSLRILVVDDSKINIIVLKAQLKSLGQIDVAAAADGQEALEALRSPGSGRFDLVLTDMWMPRLNGLGLVKAIRADPALSGLRVVVVTADVEYRATFAEIGFDGILLKPVTKDKLAEALKKEGA